MIPGWGSRPRPVLGVVSPAFRNGKHPESDRPTGHQRVNWRWTNAATSGTLHQVNCVVQELALDEYTVARRMIATTFADEPFAYGMFGESPVDRFEGMMGEYASWPDAVDPVVVAAVLAGVVVGVGYATLPGNCSLCDRSDETNEPGHSAHPIEIEFQSACRHAHLSQKLPPHAHVSTVATDHFLRGSGVGRLVVEGLLGRLATAGVDTVVLECLTARGRFYERFGFRRLTEFPDPGGPDLRSVLMRLDQHERSTGPHPT